MAPIGGNSRSSRLLSSPSGFQIRRVTPNFQKYILSHVFCFLLLSQRPSKRRGKHCRIQARSTSTPKACWSPDLEPAPAEQDREPAMLDWQPEFHRLPFASKRLIHSASRLGIARQRRLVLPGRRICACERALHHGMRPFPGGFTSPSLSVSSRANCLST